MNIQSIMILVVIAVCFVLAMTIGRRRKRSCCDGCEGCGLRNACEEKKK